MPTSGDTTLNSTLSPSLVRLFIRSSTEPCLHHKTGITHATRSPLSDHIRGDSPLRLVHHRWAIDGHYLPFLCSLFLPTAS